MIQMPIHSDSSQEMLRVLKAVRARLLGQWDHPDLAPFMPLVNLQTDCLAMIEPVIARAEEASTRDPRISATVPLSRLKA